MIVRDLLIGRTVTETTNRHGDATRTGKGRGIGTEIGTGRTAKTDIETEIETGTIDTRAAAGDTLPKVDLDLWKEMTNGRKTSNLPRGPGALTKAPTLAAPGTHRTQIGAARKPRRAAVVAAVIKTLTH
jgi:hypothetical protein